MDRLDVEQRFEAEARRAGLARICSFLFLLFSTMMVVRVQQARLDAAVSKGKRLGKIQFPWEASPFVTADTSLLTAAYLTSNEDFAALFQSSRSTQNFTTLFVSSSTNASMYEDPYWGDKVFADLSTLSLPSLSKNHFSTLNDNLQQIANSSSSNETLAIPSILSLVVDVSYMNSPILSPGCYNKETHLKSQRCYISLFSLPRKTCFDINPNHGSVDSLTSWSCLKHNNLKRNDSDLSCIHVVSANSLRSLRAQGEPFNVPSENTQKDSLSLASSTTLKFCAKPIRHLLAVDSIGNRLFFIQDMGTNQNIVVEKEHKKKKKKLMNSTMKTTLNKERKKSYIFTHHHKPYDGSGLCISTIYLDSYYTDVSPCIEIPEPIALEFYKDRPPAHIHYDAASQSLVVFRFDITNALVATVLDTSMNMDVRFSMRFENLSSGWILTSEDTSRKHILILGDKFPYAGVLHVVDLTKATDIRLSTQRHNISLRGNQRYLLSISST